MLYWSFINSISYLCAVQIFTALGSCFPPYRLPVSAGTCHTYIDNDITMVFPQWQENLTSYMYINIFDLVDNHHYKHFLPSTACGIQTFQTLISTVTSIIYKILSVNFSHFHYNLHTSNKACTYLLQRSVCCVGSSALLILK